MSGGVTPRAALELGRELTENVLRPMKQAFVGKDEVIDLLGVCLVARENLFILGPPGTAKSAVVQELAKRLDGRVFDYLLTRFTEPNEIFGPFDIRKLREGELVTNSEGMLPEADLVFLDELLNANSAILNSLLLVLNERVFRRGRETRPLATLTVVGASNRLPEDDALGALFDRFLLRAHSGNVAPEQLASVLVAGWKLDLAPDGKRTTMSVEKVGSLQALLPRVDLAAIRADYEELVHRLRRAGVAVSDRRAVKLQKLLAASALLCGRLVVNRSDLWILRHIWDTEEQQDVLAAIVDDALAKATDEERAAGHPRARGGEAPDPEQLAKSLDQLEARLGDGEAAAGERGHLRDQLSLLAARCQWVREDQPRGFLEEKIARLWEQFGESP